MELLVIGTALTLVNIAFFVMQLYTAKHGESQRPGSTSIEPLREMRELAESAFSHMKAHNAYDAAQADSIRQQTQGDVAIRRMAQEQAIIAPPKELTSLEQALADSRAGTIITKDETGQARILEPIFPGDNV